MDPIRQAPSRAVPETPEAEPRAPRTRWVAWVALVVIVAVLGTFAALQIARSGSDRASLSRAFGFDIGSFPAIQEEGSEPAPVLTGEKLGGGTLSLTEYGDKVVVLNLWASWCGPCRREQPDLERVWREYRDRGVQFLGINVRDNRASALAYQHEFDVTYPSFFDESSQLAFKLRAQVLPTTWIVNREGRIVLRLIGTVDAVLLRKVLDGTLRGAADG